MTGSFRRVWRATAVLAGPAVATTLLLSGCGAGHYAETSVRVPTSVGTNAESADNLFKVRNLSIDYLDTTGYPAGGDAPVTVALYNDSNRDVTVRVSSPNARVVTLVDAASASPSPTASALPTAPEGSPSATPGTETENSSPGASPTETPSPSPTAAPEVPAEIRIPAGQFVILSRAKGTWLQLTGLTAAVPPGSSVPVTFDFEGTRVDVGAPVAVPLSPAPAGSPLNDGLHGSEDD